MKIKSIIADTSEIKNLLGLKIVLGIIFLTTIMFLLNGCNKIDEYMKEGGSSGSGTATYNVRMTDAPGNFTEVNVDIQAVKIMTSKGKEITLNTQAGIYNLLDFQNGKDTLLATVGLDSCLVTQIRLVLGTRNTVVVDSMTYPLTIPSGSQSGLKLQVHQQLQAGLTYNVLLDFDANQSIVLTGNGRYLLKPVIRTIDTAISGSIKGLVLPAGVNCQITATDSNNVSYSTNVALDGQFILKGLPAGTYDITITPDAPFSQQTISGVNVSVGKVTLLTAINL